MNEDYQLQRIANALETLVRLLQKVSDEGITIYTHQDGPETKN